MTKLDQPHAGVRNAMRHLVPILCMLFVGVACGSRTAPATGEEFAVAPPAVADTLSPITSTADGRAEPGPPICDAIAEVSAAREPLPLLNLTVANVVLRMPLGAFADAQEYGDGEFMVAPSVRGNAACGQLRFHHFDAIPRAEFFYTLHRSAPSRLVVILSEADGGVLWNAVFEVDPGLLEEPRSGGSGAISGIGGVTQHTPNRVEGRGVSIEREDGRQVAVIDERFEVNLGSVLAGGTWTMAPGLRYADYEGVLVWTCTIDLLADIHCGCDPATIEDTDNPTCQHDEVRTARVAYRVDRATGNVVFEPFEIDFTNADPRGDFHFLGPVALRAPSAFSMQERL